MTRLGSSRTHGHDHKDMASLLRDYGADVPDAHGSWRKMRCPFHDDNSASAQTDGTGFRCFTCDVFYPAPLTLLRQLEGMSLDDAHDRYHQLAGAGGGELSDDTAGSSPLPGLQRHRASGRRSSAAGRRRSS